MCHSRCSCIFPHNVISPPQSTLNYFPFWTFNFPTTFSCHPCKCVTVYSSIFFFDCVGYDGRPFWMVFSNLSFSLGGTPPKTLPNFHFPWVVCLVKKSPVKNYVPFLVGSFPPWYPRWNQRTQFPFSRSPHSFPTPKFVPPPQGLPYAVFNFLSNFFLLVKLLSYSVSLTWKVLEQLTKLSFWNMKVFDPPFAPIWGK